MTAAREHIVVAVLGFLVTVACGGSADHDHEHLLCMRNSNPDDLQQAIGGTFL